MIEICGAWRGLFLKAWLAQTMMGKFPYTAAVYNNQKNAAEGMGAAEEGTEEDIIGFCPPHM